MQIDPVALAAGIGAALILALIANFAPRILQTDGIFSTAKLQFFIWTEVVLFAYGFLFTAHYRVTPDHVFVWCAYDKGAPKTECKPDYKRTDQGPKMPQNLLLLMGLSITAAAVSRAKGQPPALVAVVKQSGARRSLRDFISDADTDVLSLTKVQMLAWTAVAAVAYLYTVFAAYPAFVDATATSYPNVDGALLALLGLGQGAFVANRLVNSNSTD